MGVFRNFLKAFGPNEEELTPEDIELLKTLNEGSKVNREPKANGVPKAEVNHKEAQKVSEEKTSKTSKEEKIR